jgi:type VI secretion system protein ImpA
MADKLIAAHEAVRGIEAVVDERVGTAGGLDLRPLRTLTQCLAQVAQQAKAAAAPAGLLATDTQAGAGSGAAGPGVAVDVIRTREDTIRALDRVCEWIDRNEPTNPAPLLIRRAQRLMGKSFIDIIRDLAPDGLKDVERLAGVGSE